MAQLVHLGETFATLRSLRGLSVSECARAAGLLDGDVSSAERGDATPSVRQKLAALYGLRAEELSEGVASPDEASALSVFLLHGPYQDFDATDLRALERAVRAARIFGTTALGRQGLQRRMQFVPSRPSGPLPRDAARQGYKLARRVRSELGLGGAPLGDLRALLEERLGVVVVVDALVTIDLRAASALDVNRATAAAVLAADDESRRHNPLLARVYLAHELCHLLFDPSAPGRVQIALDDRPQGRTSHAQGTSVTALLESRAKGFAAEFLIPQEGVIGLFGVPTTPESSVSIARERVARVVEHFQTPWEIAVYHLKNLGFFEDQLVGELFDERSATTRTDSTSLPRAGEAPCCMRGMLGEREAWRRADVRDVEVPAFVTLSRRIAADDARASAEQLLTQAYEEVAEGRPIAATNLLMDHLDALLAGDEIDRAKTLLDGLDPTRLSPRVLTALLSLTKHAREALGETRTNLFDRSMVALDVRWGLSIERRDKIAERVR